MKKPPLWAVLVALVALFAWYTDHTRDAACRGLGGNLVYKGECLKAVPLQAKGEKK